MITESVPAALAGERLDRIVALIGDLSRAEAAATIAAGGVRVDGGPASSGKVRLHEGQTVEVDPRAIPEPVMPTADDAVDFGVVYDDDAVIVVDKPAGLVVHPGAGNMDGTLVSGLLARYPELEGVGSDPIRPGIVHRLDAGSSGLLVVARTDRAAEMLIEQFADHSATRRYDSVVWGVPDAPHGIIDAPIGRDRGDPLKMAVVAGGRPARTDYRVIGTYSSPALGVAPRMSLGNGENASDPCAPVVDQPPARRRSDVQPAPSDLGADPPIPPRRRVGVRSSDHR